jgi:D-lactate dehydrogenase
MYNERMAHKAVFFHLKHAGEGGEEYLQASEKLKAAGIEVVFIDAVLDKNDIPKDPAVIDADILGVFVESQVDQAVIDAFPNLKLIATLTTGFDHIDAKAAAARGIAVCSVPAYGENTVAEFAFTLILALSRKLPEAQARLRNEKNFDPMGLQGSDLAGKTIGVVGTGRIGKHAVRMAKGFNMNVIAFDVYHDDAFAAQMGYSYVSLEELLAKSDIVTIHAPYLPSTHHLINAKNIGLMKPTAYLINTARGAIVETAPLVEALKAKRLAGAGLDVFEDEVAMKTGDMSSIADIMNMPNVILTPHTAFNTREAFLRILDTTIDNIVGFANGTPVNLVKVEN